MKNKKKVLKSSESGKFVSREFADEHPETTFQQTVDTNSAKKEDAETPAENSESESK